MNSVVYDTGVLIAAERNDRRTWFDHARHLTSDTSILVPAGVLAQAWRGGPQPQLSRFLAGCEVLDLDETDARRVGRLCATAGSDDVADASVVVVAQRHGAGIVTADPSDLTPLVAATGVPIPIIAV